MKNIIIVHALGRNENDYWYNYIKESTEDKNTKVHIPSLPSIEQMSYTSWAKAFEPYKKYINNKTICIGHSTGSIFLVKYLMDNNLHIEKYISVVGFNQENTISANPLWDKINKTFFVENLKDFQQHAKKRISFYSPTDIYDFALLDDFATKINAEKIIIENAGHFTKGYEKQFKEIIKYLK